MSDLRKQVLEREWFYRYRLPDGTDVPTYHDDDVDLIHQTRWRMLLHRLEGEFPDGFAGLSAIDLASHQGWFALQLAGAGLRDVLGIDARERHVEDSNLMARAQGEEGVRFEPSDLFDLDVEERGRFDVVLMLGLLYHLENPVGALRIAHALCRRIFVIETQIVPGLSGMVDYGSYRYVRPLVGSFGMVDESEETHGPEASITGICLIPSLEALLWLLRKVGFREVEVLQPPPDAYEQLLYGKRVMVAATV